MEVRNSSLLMPDAWIGCWVKTVQLPWDGQVSILKHDEVNLCPYLTVKGFG